MRTAVILGRKHGEKNFVLVHGPQVGIVEQNDAVKKLLCAEGVNEVFEEVEFWTSDNGLQRRLKFRSPEAHKAHQEELGRQQSEHLKSLEAKQEAAKAEAPKEQAKSKAKNGKAKQEAAKAEAGSGD